MIRTLLAGGVLLFCLDAQAEQGAQAIYARACAACHEGQLPQAPRRGDQAVWAVRMGKGLDVLVENVTRGLNAMPPRGSCMDCTAEDYRAAIRWMAESTPGS
ncbi:c-type cytochrome [Phytopseudomonas dryadis]|uniref:Cytochrome c5 family protein n=1 Tax=Phytopseudomonas dryadis TaxID=2487520 RepID=A0A4Q9R6B0_9GAMM|nr:MULTISPECIES: c-type cytochrome [Pseudomonas]TBU96109.1 cytochrome c5 family protein [Pseudomonas dryadis]TBV01114.1 cytochrome c5 family protein [Pseudomonas dryadis]TBV13824.1 cytochrome c5 family protein [Pseudomonas sp. FRB 230]